MNGLLPIFSGMDKRAANTFIDSLITAFEQGDPDEALRLMQSFLADIPYDLSQNKPEVYFESNLYIIFKIVGFEVDTEYRTSQGHIDIVMKTPDYIMELKLDGSAESAIEQIESKDYMLPFSVDTGNLFKIGINF